MANPSRGLRFPPALQVFPALKDFIHVRPRRLASVPIACTKKVFAPDTPACLRHVYHDMGVLVFAGMNNDQISRTGEIIKRLVVSGGVGALWTSIDFRSKVKKSRLPPPPKSDYFESVSWAHAGVLKPKTLVELAESQLPDHINSFLTLRMPSLDLSTIQLRERGIQIKGNPIPKGAVQATINGPKTLPLECFTGIRVDPKFGNIYGEMMFFAGGSNGQYAGAIRVDYTLLKMDEREGTMKALWIRPDDGDMPRNAKDEYEYKTENERSKFRDGTAKALMSDVFGPLFQLEQEVYGDKADRLVSYDDNKTGLKGWRDSGKQYQPKEQNTRW